MSNLGSFDQCLVEGDPEALGRARRLRRKALGASISLELLFVVAMLLLPLITPGVLPKIYNVTPLPPYSGGRAARAARPHAAAPRATSDNAFHFPVRNAHPISRPPSGGPRFDPPDVGPDVPGGSDQIGPGMSVPGATGPAVINLPPPPKPHSEKRLVRVTGSIMEGKLIHRVDPVYPTLARNSQITGEVEVRATISTDGRIKDWVVIGGNPMFVANTIAAIRQWRYKPTLLNGEPVEVETIITVRFVMN